MSCMWYMNVSKNIRRDPSVGNGPDILLLTLKWCTIIVSTRGTCQKKVESSAAHLNPTMSKRGQLVDMVDHAGGS